MESAHSGFKGRLTRSNQIGVCTCMHFLTSTTSMAYKKAAPNTSRTVHPASAQHADLLRLHPITGAQAGERNWSRISSMKLEWKLCEWGGLDAHRRRESTRYSINSVAHTTNTNITTIASQNEKERTENNNQPSITRSQVQCLHCTNHPQAQQTRAIVASLIVTSIVALPSARGQSHLLATTKVFPSAGRMVASLATESATL